MKRKAMMSIEAALLFPLILLFFLIIIDISYITFVKSSAKSNLEFAILSSTSEMSAMKNNEFNALKRAANQIDLINENQLKRSLFDSLNMNIEEEGLKNRIEKDFIKTLPAALNNVRSISVSKKSKLYNNKFSLKYSLNFKSILSSFYKSFGLEMGKMEGEIDFKEKRIFDEIQSIDLTEELLEKHTNLNEYIDKINESINKISNKFGN